jgi:hypothetical protein
MTTQILEALRPLAVPIETLHPDPANARLHSKKNIETVKASLAKFGQRAPLVVQQQGMVVRAGNARLAAMKELGWTHAAVLIVDESDVSATAYALVDNRSSELGTWDEETLAELLGALQADPDFDHLVTGFTDAEIARLQGSVEGNAGPDATPELPTTPVTQPGDVWICGEHRVLCGDATSASDVAKVVAGETPFQLVCDPPYGVSYHPAWRQEVGLSESGRTGEVANDDRVDWTAAYRLFTGDVAYVWHAGLHAGEVAANLQSVGLQLRAQIIWKKDRFAISRGAFHWAHEPAWYGVREGRSARWCGDRTQSTVWEIAAKDDTGETNHGTQKPVECMERPMRNHGEPGDLVYDCFLGSGTSLIAAVRARRRFVGLELDPRYVDCAIERWQTYTGEKAERRPA